MKQNSVILITSMFLAHSSTAELVPGGDFEVYKPGTNYTVTATFNAGNAFARGVGNDIDLAGGTVSYSDGTSSEAPNDGIPDVDLPGWVPLQSGNDILANGVDGTTGMNLFAAWGNDGRIQSAESLGTIQSGGVYTITVMVGGPPGGPIGGPLAFHLLADGVQMSPSEIIDPVAPDGSFQLISRTYDASSIADHIGGEMTIALGVEDENDLANRVIFDNVCLIVEGEIAPPAPFLIAANPTTAGSYDFSWGSKSGVLYDLVSSTDLTTDPLTWPVWEGQADIAGTDAEITIFDISGGGDPQRFFALVEKPQ